MEEDKYQKDEHTISALEGNIKALPFLIPVVLLFGIPFYLIWGFPFGQLTEFANSGMFRIVVNLAIFAAGIVLHELIHGLTWAVFSKNGLKSIRFGMLKPSMTPYCHCKEIMRVNDYRIGIIMPAIITGFIPSIIAIAIGNSVLLVFGMLFSIAAAGDFMVLWMLRKERNSLVKDHPSRIGYVVYKEA